MANITIGRVLDSSTDSVTAVQGTPAADVDSWPVRDLAKLVPFEFDYINLSYTGNNLTQVVYRSGGSSGTIVATLTMTYTGSRLDTVTRT
jgi:hypothetical protein